MINFRLRELDKISPWGQEQELSLHWFGLTDGDLWLTFGNDTIYEYSKEAIDYWGNKSTPYNDYQLSRFIEDFTELFDKIRETIPEEFYELTKDLKTFHSDAQKWLEINQPDEDNYSDFYFEEYDKVISWTYQRAFDSGHLIGGPMLSFFRRNEKIRIVWYTEHTLENGISLWTAKDGSFEMTYSDFVEKIKAFGQSFFDQMGKQVDLAVSKDWGQIKVDKQRLIEEHQERIKYFNSSLALLDNEVTGKTNWIEIEQLFSRMTNEIQ
ncbi:MAG: DUF5984 family protein [Bacteroidia bacterium]|jgi:hypothetical protein|nr:DUF5984 family protein [Bacteroidia bacterium]